MEMVGHEVGYEMVPADCRAANVILHLKRKEIEISEPQIGQSAISSGMKMQEIDEKSFLSETWWSKPAQYIL